ncbi:GNAT family N-acetyltransferase [Gammaproteobacteria bacterium ESL0073]|nr:GNAT family N-acetyltransferase [Gammaproteobacteria bacterium ESL0073]
MSSLKPSPIFIETNNFILRTLIEQDVNEHFLTWLNCERMMSGLNLHGVQFSLESLRQFICNFNNLTNYFIGIFDKTDKTLIGFYTFDIDLKHRVGSISAAGIGETSYSGKKVFWATIDALLDYFYLYRGAEKIVARVLRKNVPMLFSFTKNPRFSLEAVLKKECLGANGERLDVIIFSSFK